MLTNYFTIAIRNLIRHKWNSVFNILGLSIAISCCVYIFFLLHFENSYDGYHKDIDRIFRLTQNEKSKSREMNFACITQKNGYYIKQNFEEVENLVRYRSDRPSLVSYKDNKYIEEKFNFVENDVFKIFSIPFILGNSSNSLERPYTAVLTQKMATKYFGSENPLGKLIKVDTAFFEVTGVMKDYPWNTRIKIDIMLSWITGNPDQPRTDGRPSGYVQTYIKLKKGINPQLFAEKIKNIPHIVEGEELARQGETNAIKMQPLKDIHFDNSVKYTWDTEEPADKKYIYILFAIGVFILVIASLNFINLSTAKYTTRIKEVAIRKTVGATRSQLVKQFLGESVLIVFISHILGMFLVELFLSNLNQITQIQFNISYSFLPLWILIISIIIIVGFIAGSYPAFILSAYKPSELSSLLSLSSKKGAALRKILVVIQFTLTIILMLGTLIIYQQVLFMKNAPLGFSKENKLVIEFPSDAVTPNNYESIKNQYLQNANIQGATISSSVPSRWCYKWRMFPSGEEVQNTKSINAYQVDKDFIEIYKIKVIAGERFSKNSQLYSGVIVSEATVNAFGWATAEEALTKTIIRSTNPVKAVMKNFHFQGLQKSIEPLAFLLISDDYRYITLQLASTKNSEDIIDFCRAKYLEQFPNAVFNYFFLDKEFERQYQPEEKTARLFMIFTIIGLTIACIGLFGLSTFMCQQKEKEIGIRKVNGADFIDIFILLSKNFTSWILLSFIIAVPIAYFTINLWLQNYAYRINISWMVIIITGITAWLIAILTVSYQTYFASIKNPIDSLKNE